MPGPYPRGPATAQISGSRFWLRGRCSYPRRTALGEVLFRERPVGRVQRLVDGYAAGGQVADRLGDDADVVALHLDEVAVDRRAVAGHDHGGGRDQAEHDVEAVRPLQRVAVGAEARDVRRARPTPRPGRRPAPRRRRGPARPGRRRCGRARGAPARPRGRRGRAPPPRRTCGRPARSRSPAPPRRAGRPAPSAYSPLIRSPAGTVRSAAVSWAWIGISPYSSRKAPLPKVWSKCSWVLTTPTTSPAPSRRTSR